MVPQRAGVDEFAQGQVIRVPTPVLVDAQNGALAFSGGDQRLGLFGIGGKGFVADHGNAMFDSFQHQGRAAFEGGGDDQRVDAGFDDLADGVKRFHTRMVGAQLPAALG